MRQGKNQEGEGKAQDQKGVGKRLAIGVWKGPGMRTQRKDQT